MNMNIHNFLIFLLQIMNFSFSFFSYVEIGRAHV